MISRLSYLGFLALCGFTNSIAADSNTREAAISLSLAVLIAVLAVWVFPVVFPGSTGLATEAGPNLPTGKAFAYDPGRLVQQVEMSFLILLPFLLALAIRRQPLLSAGLSRPSIRPGLQLGFALALIGIFLSGKVYNILNGLTAAQGIYLVAALAAAFAMEFIFRGYIQLRLMGWLGETWGWLATAAIFAVWRFLPQVSVGWAALPGAGLDLALLLVFGLILGWIMRKSGSILATGIFHAVHIWIQII